jgi:predicted ester cyclase
MADNKATIREYISRFASQDLDAVDAMHADGWLSHSPNGVTDRTNFRDVTAPFQTAFPDFTPTIHDQVAEGDKVVTRLTWSGTNSGELMGLAPTGKRGDLDVIRIDQVQDEQLVESWMMFCPTALMAQLGLA